MGGDGILAYATSGSGREGDVAVVMSVLGLFRKEIVRIEYSGVGINVWSSMNYKCSYYNGCTLRDDMTSSYDLNIFIDFPD